MRRGGRVRASSPTSCASCARASAAGSTGWPRRAGSSAARAVDDDQRAVVVELTRRGRLLWREMNVTYRRAVQRHFAAWLGDRDVAALRGVLDRVAPASALTTLRIGRRRDRRVRFAP